MADRGEQRLRKRMYKPKQFQKKKRIPRPGSSADNTKQDVPSLGADSSEGDEDVSASDEAVHDLQHETKHISDATASVEHLLSASTQHSAQESVDSAAMGTVHALDVTHEDEVPESVEQFLLELEQPRTSAPRTAPLEQSDSELSAWLDSIAIKK